MKKYLLLFTLLGGFAGKAQQPGYRIVYNVLHDTAKGNYEVFIMDMDGGNQKNLSNYAGLDWVYRTYKDRIFFISDRDTTCKRCYKLFEMDQQGNNIKKLSDLVLEDSWMDVRNNGKEMIVSASIGKDIRMQLFLVNLEDGSYRQLTKDTSAYHADPVFSPDERQIAFRYRSNRRDRNMKTEIFIMDDDGTGIKQITHYPKADTSNSTGEYHAGPPRWNRKENFISYMSFQKGKYEVYAVAPNGDKQWKITGDEKDSGWHDWTPDGRWMVVDKSIPKMKIYDIYLMNIDTRELKPLATSWKYEQAPSFVEIKK